MNEEIAQLQEILSAQGQVIDKLQEQLDRVLKIVEGVAQILGEHLTEFLRPCPYGLQYPHTPHGPGCNRLNIVGAPACTVYGCRLVGSHSH